MAAVAAAVKFRPEPRNEPGAIRARRVSGLAVFLSSQCF